MPDYDNLVKFYDPIMGDQIETSKLIQDILKKHHPNCKNLLECGSQFDL